MTLSSSLRSRSVTTVTEPDAEILAQTIREQERADRDADVAAEMDATDKIADELAADEPPGGSADT
jgi:hypothetical protein